VNGIHDMGGMHGMGPIPYEKNEPVFHAPWEARSFALSLAVDVPGPFRHQLELIPPAEYLRMSYYERWITGLIELMVKHGIVTRAEVETGRPLSNSPKADVLTAAEVPTMIAQGFPASRNVPVSPKFQIGQRVRARNINPVGHTRLPRYARGKLGTIDRDHGVFVFPDTRAHKLGDKPQHVYSVRFAARELWGEQAAPRDSVYIDLWDDYLEPA
jgi:nitrile hydratase beta subunit